MFSRVKKYLVPGYLLCLCMAGNAADNEPDNWPLWLINQIEVHPQVLAARQQMQAELSRSDALQQPLYNPELATEYEREGEDNNYRLGISQTLDWWDKRAERRQYSSASAELARQAYQQIVQARLSDALKALVHYQGSAQRYQLAQAQEARLDTLINLVRERQQAGDLGQIDVELSVLSLSQRLHVTAQAIADFKSAENHLKALLPAWQSGMQVIPERFWQTQLVLPRNWLAQHPALKVAKARFDMQKQQARLTQLGNKAEPTIGVSAGETGGESVLALNLSIPLNIRTDYSAAERAADQQALSAEAAWQAEHRRLQYAHSAATAVLQQYDKQYQRWQQLMAANRQAEQDLLQQQWQTGDLSTSEYLLALEQRNEGLAAGIDLQSQFRLARIEWLDSTGQLPMQLNAAQ